MSCCSPSPPSSWRSHGTDRRTTLPLPRFGRARNTPGSVFLPRRGRNSPPHGTFRLGEDRARDGAQRLAPPLDRRLEPAREYLAFRRTGDAGKMESRYRPDSRKSLHPAFRSEEHGGPGNGFLPGMPGNGPLGRYRRPSCDTPLCSASPPCWNNRCTPFPAGNSSVCSPPAPSSHGPRFLFLDRPLTEIDSDFRPVFLDIIQSHVRTFGWGRRWYRKTPG